MAVGEDSRQLVEKMLVSVETSWVARRSEYELGQYSQAEESLEHGRLALLEVVNGSALLWKLALEVRSDFGRYCP